jgi:hypothetical protein
VRPKNMSYNEEARVPRLNSVHLGLDFNSEEVIYCKKDVAAT